MGVINGLKICPQQLSNLPKNDPKRVEAKPKPLKSSLRPSKVTHPVNKYHKCRLKVTINILSSLKNYYKHDRSKV